MNAEKVHGKAHHNVNEKAHDKVMEKRRALGRGLESLLPRPRSITATAAEPARPQTGQHLEDTPSNGQAGTPGSPTQSGSDVPASGTPVPSSIALSLGASSPKSAMPGGGTNSEIPNTPVSLQATAAELTASSGTEEVVQLPLGLIDRNPHQTRTRFREEPLKELAESIKVQGVLQPVVVRPGQEGRYRLILGERRMRASVMAGFETIPAIVKRVSEQQAAEMTLVENLQRQDLNCVEQAWAFSRMSQEFKLTQEQIGARVGMSREAVSNYMRLLTLPEGVHDMLIAGKLSYSHARALLKLNTSSHELLWAYAKKALDEKMSVAKLEELVEGLPRAPKAPGQGGARWVDPNVKAAQRKLEEILGMRVRIRDRAGRGKILIEYATIDDFDRVVEMLGGK
jgi:ParB family transcriptional regulator, chromosome partitioning protein